MGEWLADCSRCYDCTMCKKSVYLKQCHGIIEGDGDEGKHEEVEAEIFKDTVWEMTDDDTEIYWKEYD